MYLTAVGTVQEVKRNINGTKLSIVTLRQPYSGQTVEDGKWGERGTGFFQYRVWEENLQAGTNTNFVRFLDGLKNGSTVEILAEAMMIKTIKEGVAHNNITLTALRIGYAGARQQDETPKVRAEREEEQTSFGSEEEFADPIEQW